MDRIGELDGRTSEEHATGVYGKCFTVGSLARVGPKGAMREPGIKLVLTKS